MKIIIAYCSPAGSTRRVAEVIHNSFIQRNADVVTLDLTKENERSSALDLIKTTDQKKCLFIIPKKVDLEACTQCGICEEECPLDAVILDPYPGFNQSCIDCFNCIRLCPEETIASSVSMDDIADHIRKRVATINEQPLTQVFL